MVVNRTRATAAETASLAPQARIAALDEVAAADVIVNATPIGMAGGPDPGGVPVPVEVLDPRHVVVDIVYQPRQTPLLAAASEIGATGVNGVGMLVHQAALAFELWTGETAPLGVMGAAVSEAVAQDVRQ
jgi:shikimate dehydrogenase